VQLQGFINAAQTVVEDVVGHIISATFTAEAYDGGDVSIFLRHKPCAGPGCNPILTITTLQEIIGITGYTLTLQPVGQAVDNFGYTVDDPTNGRITRRSSGSQPYPFYKNIGNVFVTYTVGADAVPPHVRLGCLELIRHMYQWGQQAFGEPTSWSPRIGEAQDEGYSYTPSGYLIPNRVKELLQPSQLDPVFA